MKTEFGTTTAQTHNHYIQCQRCGRLERERDALRAEVERLREALSQKPFPMQLDDALKEIDVLRERLERE